MSILKRTSGASKTVFLNIVIPLIYLNRQTTSISSTPPCSNPAYTQIWETTQNQTRCKNSGTCHNLPEWWNLPVSKKPYFCQCSSDFFGPHCETEHPCDNSQLTVCLNGGICHKVTGSEYNCECVNYFNGEHCENLPPCSAAENPCRNNSTCSNT